LQDGSLGFPFKILYVFCIRIAIVDQWQIHVSHVSISDAGLWAASVPSKSASAADGK
jgi:hypothetical protein